MRAVSQNIDRMVVVSDDPNLVANAGLVTVATLAVRLGLERLIDRTVRLGGRVGGANPGSKILTLVLTLVAGGSHIDHADMLRSGATRRVLPFRVAAPSTLGTFLRSFTFGHVRQLDRVIAETIQRVWRMGVGPGSGRLIIDIDSTICEVFGDHKQGAAYGYTGQKGYHPLVATRADTGELLHVRLRDGASRRGTVRFVQELVARVRRAGASGEILLRADAGFWSRRLIDTCDRLGIAYSITVVSNPTIRAVIEQIPESGWVRVDHPSREHTEVASVAYTSRGRHGQGYPAKTLRLIVRRDPLPGTQDPLWPQFRYHVTVTNRHHLVTVVDREHRQHATVELAIRDLKEGAGLSHLPSGNFAANAAWLGCAALAHNLIRWTVLLGEPHHQDRLTVARTIRTQLIALPARLVNRAGRLTLRLPTHWPWTKRLLGILTRLRALPQPA